MMLKEHIVERYGAIRYTIGQRLLRRLAASTWWRTCTPGCSTASSPTAATPTSRRPRPTWSTATCSINYFDEQPQPAVGAAPIDGHRDPSDCAMWEALFYGAVRPRQRAATATSPADRCTTRTATRPACRCDDAGLRGSRSAASGRRACGPRREEDRGRVRQSAVRQRRRAVRAEALQIGADHARAVRRPQRRRSAASTIDHKSQAGAQRRRPETASKIAYRTGPISDARQLDNVPIIDLRGYSESGEIHTSFHTYAMRARLDRANGNHGNQIIWTFAPTAPIAPTPRRRRSC